MADSFSHLSETLVSPLSSGELVDISGADHVFAVTPRALQVSAPAGGATVIVRMQNDVDVPISVASGTSAIFPYRPKAVVMAGTTAGAVIWGLW